MADAELVRIIGDPGFIAGVKRAQAYLRGKHLPVPTLEEVQSHIVAQGRGKRRVRYPSSWGYQVTRNMGLEVKRDWVRKEKALKALLVRRPLASISPYQEAVAQELRERVETLAARAMPVNKRILSLLAEGYGADAIIETLIHEFGFNKITARIRLFRAREQLRKVFREMGSVAPQKSVIKKTPKTKRKSAPRRGVAK